MKKVLMALPLLVVAAPTLASDFYLLADVGKSKYEVDGISEKENAFGIGAGFKLNSTFALELAWRDFGEITGREGEYYDANNYWRENYSFSSNSFQASLLGSLPLNDALSVYGRVGLASIDYELGVKYEERSDGVFYRDSDGVTKTKTKTLFGLGLDYRISQAFSLRIDYSLYDDYNEIEISSTTLGLTFAL